MPTGSGKTLLTATLLVALCLKDPSLKQVNKEDVIVLFLAPRDVLRQQAYEAVKSIIEGVLKIHVKKLEPVGMPSRDKYWELLRQVRGVVITTPQLLNSIYKRWLHEKELIHLWKKLSSARIIVFDEVHTYYVGKKMKELITYLKKRSRAKLVLGLTATPTKESKELLGDLLYSYSSFDAMDEGVLIPRLKVIRYNTYVKGLKLEQVSRDLHNDRDEWKFAIYERAEEYANKIIEEAKRLEESAKRLPKILVVSVNTTEADLISEHLRTYAEKYCLSFILLKAHYKEAEPKSTIEMFKRLEDPAVLVTVNMADIGFDDPNLDMLVIARPFRSPVSYVQVRGRVLRKPKSKYSVKKILGYATIVDLVGEATKHEKRDVIEAVEKGVYGERDFKNAGRELRGEGEVNKVHAETVQVIGRKEFIIPSPIRHPTHVKLSFNSYDILNATFYVREKEDLRIRINTSNDLREIVRKIFKHGLYLTPSEAKRVMKRIEELINIAKAFQRITEHKERRKTIIVDISKGKLKFSPISPRSSIVIVTLSKGNSSKNIDAILLPLRQEISRLNLLIKRLDIAELSL